MTSRGASRPFQLSAELTDELRELGRSESTTLFVTLLAAFMTLLHRHSRQDDLVVGSPVANRNRSETEPLIGLFVNTLVLRTDLSGNPAFREILRRARDTTTEAYRHQDLPFEQLVEELKPERSLSYAPLFQVMFALQDTPARAEIPGLTQTTVSPERETSRFDLTLRAEVHADGLRGTFEYSTDLYEAATIDRMIGHWGRLLEGIVAEPARRIWSLPLLGEHERHQLLASWNDTSRDITRECVHEMFERHAATTPTHTAAIFEATSLTYGELNARANQLARHLQSLGVRGETLVGIAMERSLDMIVSLLAILKAGAAYLPLDPSYPSDRIEFMIGDARPMVLLVQDALRSSLPVCNTPMIAVDSEWSTIAAQPTENLGVIVPPQSLIYVIYTSGSTGRPKGAMNTHRGTTNHLSWLAAQFDVGPSDRTLQKIPISFDASVSELFLPLVCGGRLVMANRDGHHDPTYQEEMIRTQGITTIAFVPSMLAVFLEAESVERCTSLRRVFVGGEAVPQSVVQRLRSRLAIDLVNFYGPTEASDVSTFFTCTAEGPPVVPIGRPITNVTAYVLDRELELAPLGAAGEIHIAGASLARGYLNRPGLTAERFIPDPFARSPGGRMYKTGDLGRVRADGVIEFLGRVDHQVKVRGFRIELGEIEAMLARHPSLRDALADVREDTRGDKRLIAYVVGNNVVPSVDELRAYLGDQLPEYMVPSAFVVLDALPLTPNGKVDRKALPAPALPTSERPYVAPQTAVEKTLAMLWAELLGVERVGRDDNFFELGGHSLLAMQLVGRLHRLGVSSDVRNVFATQTLAALAVTLGHAHDDIVPANALRPDSISVTPRDLPLISLAQPEIDRIVARIPGGLANIEDIYGLSPLQAGMLFHHQLANDGDPYVLTRQMAFDDRAQLDRYLAAMQRMVDRYDVFRTSFVWDGLSEPAQVVWRHATLAVAEIELGAAGQAGAAELARRFDSRRYRMDLTEAPLLRFVIAREPATERWFALEVAHHLIADHVTIEVLHDEIVAQLARTRARRPTAAAVPKLDRARTRTCQGLRWRHVLSRPARRHRRADASVRTRRSAWRRRRHSRSASHVGELARPEVASAGSPAGCEPRESVSPGLGTGRRANERPRERRLRDGAVGPECARRGSGDGAVHEHVADPARSGSSQRGRERSASSRDIDRAVRTRACVAGARAAMQWRDRSNAIVQCATKLSLQ